MKTVLLAGATGMLGARIGDQLARDPEVELRVLVRDATSASGSRRARIDALTAAGANLYEGDLADSTSLDAAAAGVDIIVSSVQGGREVVVDGQQALMEAGQRQGARRFIPSDFALDIFAAPHGAPTLDLRREAADNAKSSTLQVLHILNGGFMDMMLAKGGGWIDLADPQVFYWGTGAEQFDLTTVEDTAKFTALLAVDDDAAAGTYQISGSRTSVNDVVARIEAHTGATVSRHNLGTVQQLEQQLRAAGDPWEHVMEWYSLALFSTPAFTTTDNDRYPSLTFTTLDDHLDAHGAA